MLFSEIIAGNYRVFARQKEDERSRNIQVVKYIETLASMTSTDIMSWNAKKLFGTGTGNKLIDDKNEINRIFFSELERLSNAAAPVPAEGDILTAAMTAQIKAAEARHVATLVARETENATRLLRDAQRQYRAVEDFIKRSGEHMANARRLTGQRSNIESQIRAIAAMPFWSFTGIENEQKIVFKTRGDIIVSHKNPAAGIDITLNFGKFRAVYDLSSFNLRVYGADRNMSVRGYPHPHISNNGNICWGSAADAAIRMLSSCNLQEPMVLLATLLTNYNSGNPFVSMEAFQESQGTPEEQIAMAALEDTRDATQARMAPLDALEIDVNLEMFDQPEPVAVIETEEDEVSVVEERPPESAIENIENLENPWLQGSLIELQHQMQSNTITLTTPTGTSTRYDLAANDSVTSAPIVVNPETNGDF